MEQAMTKMPTLSDLITQYHEMEEALFESGGELTPEIGLDQWTETFDKKIDNCAGLIGHLKSQIEWLKAESDRYSSRAKTLTNAIDNIRERMIWAMNSCELRKLKTARYSVSIGESESWKIDEDRFSNEDLDKLIEKGLAERTQSYKVDIRGLKAEYKDTFTLPEYIAVSRRSSITIR